MKTSKGILGVVTLALLTFAPLGAATTITVGGVGAALALMRELGEAFAQAHPGSTVRVLESLGSGGGIRGVADGRIDVALSGRPLLDAESALGLTTTPLARTPVVFIAHRGVSESGVRRDQLIQDIGKKAHWSDGTRRRMVLRPPWDSDTLAISLADPSLGAIFAQGAQEGRSLVTITGQQNVTRVASIQGALGYSTLMLISTERPNVKVLAYEGVTPSVKAMRSGAYPFSSDIYLVTTPTPSPAVTSFLAFINSDAGRRLVAERGADPLPER